MNRSLVCSILVGLLASACVGQISDAGEHEEPGRRATDTLPPSGDEAVITTIDELDVYSRLTKQEYRYVVVDLLAGADQARQTEVLLTADAFNENNYSGYYKNYDPIGVYPGLESAQLDLARSLATAFVESDLYATLCASECAENVADSLLPRIWKRRIPAAERQELVELYDSFSARTRDYYFFLRVFASPYFHYKIFAPTPEDEDEANIKNAQLVSFALTGSFPDEALQADVDRGVTRWQHHIARLLSEHPGRFSRLFVPQWLGMASSYESDEEYHGVPLRTVMLEPALIFAEALKDDASVSSLISLDFNMVDPSLATLYGSSLEDGETGWRRQALIPTFFGTAAMSYLTVDHESGNPSPIRRGSYIVNHFLCRSIAFPPSEVQSEVDRVVNAAPEGLSPPERMAYFRSHATCAGCHEQMDPYGLALEEVGAFGEVRETYYTGDPVEASGTAGDITYTSSIDFSDQLASTRELNTCFASQVYSYLSSSSHVESNRDLTDLDDQLLAMSASEIVAAMVLRAIGEDR